ncbi:MAG: type IX secretion system sortase PorU [Bacteroidales bacterium]|jgi:hypothetical protein
MKKQIYIFLLLLFSVFFNYCVFSQEIVNLNWTQNINIENQDFENISVLNFQDAQHLVENNYLPLYYKNNEAKIDNAEVEFTILETFVLDKNSLKDIDLSKVDSNFKLNYYYSYNRKKPFLNIKVLPIKYDKETDQYEVIKSFTYNIDPLNVTSSPKKEKSGLYDSPLKSGNWYKIFVSESGFYKITYNELKSLGLDIDNINPKTIKIYGYGGGMLPEITGEFRHTDLHQIPITIVGEEDGKFNSTDYITFYAGGPDKWEWDEEKRMFIFSKNYYSRKAGYYITYGNTNGKRYSYKEPITDTIDFTLNKYVDCQGISPTEYKPLPSGRTWFSEPFMGKKNYKFNFNSPAEDHNNNSFVYYSFVGRQLQPTTINVKINDVYDVTHNLKAYSPGLETPWGGYVNPFSQNAPFFLDKNEVNIEVDYHTVGLESKAILDQIDINTICKAIYNGGELEIRYFPHLLLHKNVFEYSIYTNDKNIEIYDISDPADAKKVKFDIDGNLRKFKSYNDTSTYICFNNSNFKTVELGTKISNQNIHGITPPEYVIVYKKHLKDQAEQLYNYHKSTGKEVAFIEIDLVYNEFSSGVQDGTAIRDMLKYWYDNAPEGKEPKYLLLFGATSYDPLNRISSNAYDLPSYQSKESISPNFSYCTDDFFGCLDDGEGNLQNSGNIMDIAVGRIPTHEVSYAKDVTNKILNYLNHDKEKFGNWQNRVTLVCDDADKVGDRAFLKYSEVFADEIKKRAKYVNIKKIYCNAYEQITTPGGQKYPDVNKDIKNNFEEGTLLWMYMGHSGPKQIAHEEIVSSTDANSWQHFNKLPFIVTYSCSLMPFDDPSLLSVGHYILYNPQGGAVALLASTRSSWAAPSRDFGKSLIESLFPISDNKGYPTVGQAVAYAKNQHANNIMNTRQFVLFGDPAMPLNYPKLKNKAKITELKVDEMASDTIRALSTVNIKGVVEDNFGNVNTNFNGLLYVDVLDKPKRTTSLGNDDDLQTVFYVENSYLYKGKVNIENGNFSFNFIVPKDIAYNYDTAKMYFYFHDDIIDGNGYYDEFLVGGVSNSYIEDNTGPDITLYLDKETFQDGDEVSENPILYAKLYDESGINTTGSSIGHDLIAYLNDSIANNYVLNEYYENDLNSFQSGSIKYNLYNMPAGRNKITLRAWDVFNNSSSKSVNFVVLSSDEILISDLITYPNPFEDNITFQISNNQSGKSFDATLYIMDFNGKLIKTLKSKYYATGINDNIFEWDGTTDMGNKIGKGIYLYRLLLVSKDGKHAISSGKLIKK